MKYVLFSKNSYLEKSIIKDIYFLLSHNLAKTLKIEEMVFITTLVIHKTIVFAYPENEVERAKCIVNTF